MQNRFENLPSVNAVLEHPGVHPLLTAQGRDVVVQWVRAELSSLREQLSADFSDSDRSTLIDQIAERIADRSRSANQTKIGAVINATGVILHTGLGRAPLSQAARAGLADVAGAANLELDLDSNDRRYRGHQLQHAWHTLTGCEDSLIVNNNAAATLLVLQALCKDREVVISRGQLIEIGGSFRLPEIFELGGVRLREVGTTNRTRLSDYERAIGPETAAVMVVHHSNYKLVGFAEEPDIREIVELAHRSGLILIHDIGSGSLLDLSRFGMLDEPSFPQSIAAGADLVLGSGDKLLGGPQAGIILGSSQCVETVRNHPLARAVRVDKLALGALSATLDSYLRGSAESEIPTIAMLVTALESLETRAATIAGEFAGRGELQVDVKIAKSAVGGGSLPGLELPTAALAVAHPRLSPDDLARRLRLGTIRVMSRIHAGELLIDLRSVLPEDDSRIAQALREISGIAD